MKRGFQKFVMTLFKTLKILFFSFTVLSLFRALRGFFFRTCMVKYVMLLNGASRIVLTFFCIFCSPSWFPFSTHAILLIFYASCKYPFFLICKYIFFCTSYLTGILLVDYLLVVLVYSSDKEFAVDFFPRWRQYLSLFFWIHFSFLDWCLESKVIYLD